MSAAGKSTYIGDVVYTSTYQKKHHIPNRVYKLEIQTRFLKKNNIVCPLLVKATSMHMIYKSEIKTNAKVEYISSREDGLSIGDQEDGVCK